MATTAKSPESADKSNVPTMVGIFDDRLAAERAVDELTQSGFNKDQVGFVLRGSDVTSGGMLTDTVGAKDGKGAVTGAVTGALAGGLTAAAVTALIPGVGPILAAGTLAMFFGYAAAGAAIGGIFGALTGLGISEDEARYYEKAFTEGKALVAVKPGTRAAEAGQILRRHGGYDLQNQTDSSIPTTGIFSEP
ncbi:MAG: hypothetical protein H7Z14_11045 [Anaerolineae bacterium]|nr:hypothetical protein [Phycisphaerae bacterium]